ncbi:MAG: three-Cys-motif partner protein TcmP, partial [Proteobacteria bacterium]|nr:three-Cys-motif partner protein TcmP [Pseudomonadota bacterium]
LPQQRRFRLAIVDGFSGAGKYACGSPGSPIIFLQQLDRALKAVNLNRKTQDLDPVEIECLFIFNDADAEAIELLKQNYAPVEAEIRDQNRQLHMSVEYMNGLFEVAYLKIKEMIAAGRFRNIIFNLDQCGDSQVALTTLADIMRSTPAAEIFYTLMIKSLIAFLSPIDRTSLTQRLAHFGMDENDLLALDPVMSKDKWLGVAERLVFDSFKVVAPFHSPFSIKNPNGWRYWLIHFANRYRARQVYNNVLHDNSTSQAHFGRAGLNMLAYDPSTEGKLYLFEHADREIAKAQLLDDIPRLVSELGDTINVGEFYESVYNMTPAHAEEIHAAMIEHPDLEVLTSAGGTRRVGNAISVDDTLRLKKQRTLFPLFKPVRSS